MAQAAPGLANRTQTEAFRFVLIGRADFALAPQTFRAASSLPLQTCLSPLWRLPRHGFARPVPCGSRQLASDPSRFPKGCAAPPFLMCINCTEEVIVACIRDTD